MTEYEQCMLMMLKEIKSQLSGINDGLYSVSTQLKTLNENHDSDWTYNIHKDLQDMNEVLIKFYSLADERV